MSGLSKYLGELAKLQNQDTEVDVSSLSGKLVFLYFSASWCPPCRGFTPQLAEFYNKHSGPRNFEVVLATWDEDKDDFTTYYAKMPWLAIPFSNRSLVETLSKEFEVTSIPTMIGIDADSGEVVTRSARHALTMDPEGEKFPWKDDK
ncbi:hypothetical protein CUR178_04181 [Leishmania enriettii]|uniref:Thioredoxin domain-containing protein n=1 Tax=Leishmania enriettii TaxID=5663 RepID=A0A836HBY6_LEIEN|nr:hypothetical protein CUR178_04181 [Leishmania enriettii]